MRGKVASLFLFVLLCTESSIAVTLSCKNAQNAAVDYWIGLKLPGSTLYYVFDGTSWSSSSYDLSKTSGHPVANTLQQVYQNASGTGYTMYNDQTPDGKALASRGHTKGVFGFSSTGGFWLVHSVPKFPDFVSNGYSYPDPQAIYAQSFICVSFTSSMYGAVMNSLNYNQPQVYDFFIPPTQLSAMRLLDSVCAANFTADPNFHTEALKTTSATPFTVFSKTRQWDNDLWEVAVEPKYATGMNVNTWLNGVGSMPSCCPSSKNCTYPSMNVATISLKGTTWPTSKDHSKWAVSTAGSAAKVVCVGDINRQYSQRRRGGGALCISSSTVTAQFQPLIASVTPC
eukprot:TRINITY_DN11390_c0_g1_i1.p1 TRINITY_DN11390_c0_g1~~TRINITY_DN11390_c0_g1_i1.p1  ORF type:complete len:342 (+),score=70.99 TRINITY_DN11390_c0_g1_i1:62-1087(+)